MLPTQEEITRAKECYDPSFDRQFHEGSWGRGVQDIWSEEVRQFVPRSRNWKKGKEVVWKTKWSVAQSGFSLEEILYSPTERQLYFRFNREVHIAPLCSGREALERLRILVKAFYGYCARAYKERGAFDAIEKKEIEEEFGGATAELFVMVDVMCE